MSTTSSSRKKRLTIALNNASIPNPPRKRLRVILWWFLTLLWAGVIFQLSTETYAASFTAWVLAQILSFLHISISPATFATLHFLMRKAAHATEYAIFSLVLYRALQPAHQFEWRARTAGQAVLVAGDYALADEFHQWLVPGRTASLIDCGIDTAGAALGILLVYASDRVFAGSMSGRPAVSRSGHDFSRAEKAGSL